MTLLLSWGSFGGLALLLAFASPAFAGNFDACADQLPRGAPTVLVENSVAVCHKGYAALVDEDALVPRWVAYVLMGKHTLGCVARSNNFHVEPAMKEGRHASPSDYVGSGYDMGHQASDADFAWDEGETSDSFSMANMAPQVPGLNRQQWERLEETVRAWAWGHEQATVYVGPVLSDHPKTIGKDKVAVPSAFWKVIVDGQTQAAIGFEFPQKAIAKGDLEPWVKPIEEIEHDAHIMLPLPSAIDIDAKAKLWPVDLGAWRAAHKQACSE